MLISEEEKTRLLQAQKLMNSSTNDAGDLVKKPFRMCGFVPINVPILCGMLMAPPTMKYTALFQWMN